MRALTFKEVEGEGIRNFACTRVFKIYFHAKVDTATIHQGRLCLLQYTNKCLMLDVTVSTPDLALLHRHLEFSYGNDHSEALRQLFRSKTKAISPFDRKGKAKETGLQRQQSLEA